MVKQKEITPNSLIVQTYAINFIEKLGFDDRDLLWDNAFDYLDELEQTIEEFYYQQIVVVISATLKLLNFGQYVVFLGYYYLDDVEAINKADSDVSSLMEYVAEQEKI